MSLLLSGTTDGVNASAPEENQRIGINEFMELYRTVAYNNNTAVGGCSDQRTSAIQALRSRRVRLQTRVLNFNVRIFLDARTRFHVDFLFCECLKF